MSEIRYYTVTQEREVKVEATTAVDAARLADRAFNPTYDETPKDLVGQILSVARVRDIRVTEDY